MTVLYGIPLVAKVLLWYFIRAPQLLFESITSKASSIAKLVFVLTWDFSLFVINHFTPPLKRGSVVRNPKTPGYKGIWPEFVAPTKEDSRSPCPGLNALANHGVLPHNGRNIKLDELQHLLHDVYNFSPTLCAATIAQVKDAFKTDIIDLDFLTTHNVIAHDASMLRQDEYFGDNQSAPSKELITKLLASASGGKSALHVKGYLTPADLSRYLSIRRAQSERDNPHYTLADSFNTFAMDNTSVLQEIYGGDVASMESLLLEERIPNGWESWVRTRNGLTIADLHLRSAEISLGLRKMKL